MAATQKIIEDLGSEEVRLVRTMLNALIDVVEALQSPTIATADADATYGQPEADLINEIKAALNAMAAVDVSGLKKYVASRERPAPPSI